jgi:hypothetical protein
MERETIAKSYQEMMIVERVEYFKGRANRTEKQTGVKNRSMF